MALARFSSVAATTLLALCLASATARAEDRWWGPDKALHFGVSIGIGAGGYAVSTPFLSPRWQRAVAGGTAVVVAGAGKEGVDALGAGQASARDFTWDLAGGAVGVGLALLVDLIVRGPHPAARAPDGAAAAGAGCPARRPLAMLRLE